MKIILQKERWPEQARGKAKRCLSRWPQQTQQILLMCPFQRGNVQPGEDHEQLSDGVEVSGAFSDLMFKRSQPDFKRLCADPVKPGQVFGRIGRWHVDAMEDHFYLSDGVEFSGGYSDPRLARTEHAVKGGRADLVDTGQFFQGVGLDGNGILLVDFPADFQPALVEV